MAHLTEAAIQDTFLKLLSEQPFDKITVTQLVDECQITRRTFYYHYSDLYELLDTILRRETERALDEFEATGSWEECMITASRFASTSAPCTTSTHPRTGWSWRSTWTAFPGK